MSKVVISEQKRRMLDFGRVQLNEQQPSRRTTFSRKLIARRLQSKRRRPCALNPRHGLTTSASKQQDISK
eukprot:6609172-Pyramimonas_sp.AAC.2